MARRGIQLKNNLCLKQDIRRLHLGSTCSLHNSGASVETCAPTKIRLPYPTSAGCPPSKLHLATHPQASSHSHPRTNSIQVVKHVVRSLNYCKWMQLAFVCICWIFISKGPTLVDVILMFPHIVSHSHFTSFHQATLCALAPVHLLAEPPAASLPSVAQGVDASHHPWPQIWSITEPIFARASL